MMDFQAPDSLTEQVAQHLGEKIIKGELKPGDRIQEVRFASEMGVSRGSIREAFLILESRYLIKILPRKGAIVSEMSTKQVEDIYDAMIILLIKVARNAAQVWQDEDLPEFQDLLQRMQEYVTSQQVVDFYEASFEFYCRASRFILNSYLGDVLENLLPTIRRTYYLALHSSDEELQVSLAFFNQLFAALLQRDSDQASQIIEEFANHQCRIVLNAIAMSKPSL